MRNDRSHLGGRIAAVAALVLVFAASWIALSLTDNRPGWLVVEAPETAVVGKPLEIRVTLKRSVKASQINCSLHRANAERRGWGYLASSGPSRPAAGGGTYSFVFEVPERENTAFAFALIYLSPTGKWEDGTRAATAKYLPVTRDNAAGANNPGLRKTEVFRYPTAAHTARAQARARTERPPGRPSVWVHPLLGLLLLAAAIFSWIKARRSRTGEVPGEMGEGVVWLAFAALLAASAAVEFSGIAGHITTWGRRLAVEQGVYDLRRPAQKAIMAAVASACLGLFILFIRAVRRPGPHRALWWAGIGLAAFLAVSFVSALSFHAVDVARRMLWHGVSPVDAVRGAGALVAFLAALTAVRWQAGRTPI